MSSCSARTLGASVLVDRLSFGLLVFNARIQACNVLTMREACQVLCVVQRDFFFCVAFPRRCSCLGFCHGRSAIAVLLSASRIFAACLVTSYQAAKVVHAALLQSIH